MYMSENVLRSTAAKCFLNQQEDKTDSDRTPADKSADVFSRQIPPNASDPQSADSLIASQMAKLSVADRERVYMDVHGISDDAQETPELIQESLMRVQTEIDVLPDKRAYNIAEQLDPKYVRDRDFRLSFIRCEKFDCQKAALRIVRHFQMKLDLFGTDKLAMDITQDDLDMDDMDVLYGCSSRFLNAYDSGGRIINFLVGVPKVYKTDAVLRRSFYNIMMTFRDNPEVQRRGAVTICWGAGDVKGTSGDNADINWKLPKLNQGSPMRISALYLCYTDEVWKNRVALIRTALNKQIQVRARVYYGTVSELMQNLRRHGVDPTYIPVNECGEMSDRVETCRRLEQQRRHERLKYPRRKSIGIPSTQDVLLGKGSPFQNHSGNKALRQLVKYRYKEYEGAKKGTKKAIAQEIVNVIIMVNGGLFLKQDGNKWAPANDEVAILKDVLQRAKKRRYNILEYHDFVPGCPGSRKGPKGGKELFCSEIADVLAKAMQLATGLLTAIGRLHNFAKGKVFCDFSRQYSSDDASGFSPLV